MSKAPFDDKGTVSAEWLVGVTGYTERWLRTIASQGYFPPPVRARYQAGKTLLGIIKYQGEQLRKKSDTLRQEQEAYTKAKRELAEEELAQFRGEYVAMSEIGPALRNCSLHMRTVLKRKLEQELAPNLQGMTTVEILKKMRQAIVEIHAAFYAGIEKWLEAPPAKE